MVFMMQENRSFDHYFGTLRGVRGFGDPRAVKLATGKSVFHQPDSQNPDGYLLPFHPDAPHLGLQFLEDTPHDWTGTHAAWNGGAYDQWVPQKGATSMAHLTRQDIPFHYALADAFTVCDAYHCSLLGPTDPNRYHMWTGWVGNDGSGGGPVIDNAELGHPRTRFFRARGGDDFAGKSLLARGTRDRAADQPEADQRDAIELQTAAHFTPRKSRRPSTTSRLASSVPTVIRSA